MDESLDWVKEIIAQYAPKLALVLLTLVHENLNTYHVFLHLF